MMTDQPTIPVPCVVCGKTFRDAMPESGPNRNQPSDGTAFVSHGHYGSTVFDPFNASMIEINFCDPCLREAAEKKRVLWKREAKALTGAPPWPESCIGWVPDESPYEVWRPDDEAQCETVEHRLGSREELAALVEQHGGLRNYEGVKLNGSFTVETVWAE
jgi:hypothetical protein